MTRLVKLESGQIVDLDDPKQLNTRQLRALAGTPRGASSTPALDPEVKRRADAHESGAEDHWWSLGSFGRKLQDNVARPLGHGLMLGFDDEIRGGIHAAGNAVGNLVGLGNGESIGQDYVHQRDTERELARRAADRHPVINAAAEIGGAVTNPIGDGATGLRVLAKGADALGLSRSARAAAGLGRKIEQTYVPVKAALAGANQGALNAAGNADSLSDVPEALADGYLAGGVAGGVLGGAVHAGAKVVQTLRDAGSAAAPRIAAARVGELLDKGGMTPTAAAGEIAASDAGNLNPLTPGQGAMIGELTPGLRARAANISKQIDVPSSNALIERGRQRIDERGQQFANQMRGTADNAGGTINFDAPEHLDSIVGARKARGQADYAEGGVMDAPIHQSAEIQAFLKDAPPATDQALRGAYNDMLTRREVPGVMLPRDPDTGTITAIPNMRAFDYAKRRFDSLIGQAIRSGDTATAQGLSSELTRLKDAIKTANPGYAAILDTQRDLFQQQRATEIGQTVLKRMASDPRSVLRELTALPKEHINDARVGIVDAFINNTRTDPVQMYQSLTRTPPQKKILEFALGGPDKLAEFEAFIMRENRARDTDKLLAPGYQSATETYRQGAGGGDASPGAQLAQQAGRGYAFGGTIGAATSAMRYLAKLATSNSTATQEEIAKILLGKGEGLAARVQEAAQFTSRRQARNARRAVLTAKAGQQGITDLVGGH